MRFVAQIKTIQNIVVGGIIADVAPSFRINSLIADGSQFASGIGRAATTATIDGNSLVLRQFCLCLLHKVAFRGLATTKLII